MALFKYILKRVLRSMLTLLLILSIVFILVRLMPIDGYFDNYDKMTEQQIQNGLHQLGLDQPIFVQLWNFFKNMILHGDLGVSNVYRKNVPVMEILAPKLPVSIRLGCLSLLLALLVGLPVGTLMARYTWCDNIGTVFIVLIQAVPAAVYYLFIQLIGINVMGSTALKYSADVLQSWILPIFSMALGNIAYYAMWLRRYMVDERNKDYIMLARIKGASETRIMFRHVFKNAFVPMVQYLPTSFLNTVIGSIYIEALYSIPGMGGLLVDVIKKQDNAMIQGIVFLYAFVGVIGLLLGDLLMSIMDPRISFVKKGGDR